MSRIAEAFARRDGVGLVTYVSAGDPDPERWPAIALALDRAGAEIIEVGVPFSDPLADGPVIQRASERALAAGTTLARVLEMVAGIRSRIRAALVLFTYANPILRMGRRRFVEMAADAGVDGVLVLDLPLEEADELRALLREHGIDMIFLISPTTSDARLRRAAELASGFLYAVSRLGVTGARDTIASGVEQMVGRIRAASDLPVAVGFGISTAEHVAQIGRWADAAVVGSSLVSVIERFAGEADLPDRVADYVRGLRGGIPAERERARA